uniref:protein NUCLEAR FUSION DEFECTIVE 6, mitochondrial-like n=1 Tax=Erigeron canadensis TaxID=72917 RepID=UPI001CB959D6|nr:protein NUCLEAR FUSION DEFECTIVE 6, mitochondrial-like [Erigeron canadensis]
MASSRQVFQKSAGVRSLFRRTSTFTKPPSNLFNGPVRRKPLFSSREPVELSCMQSLMPLHSATASSLLKSMLSSEVGQWGSLSEGFATPL